MPQHNDVFNRRNRTLLDMVRSMMSHTDLPKMFWGHVLDTASYTLNRVPSKSVDSTPYEMWYGKKPCLDYLRVWSCYAYVKCNKSNKLGARSDKCNFAGYPKETREYYFYHPIEQKVLVLKHAIFLEDEILLERDSDSKIEISEVKEPQCSEN